MAEKKVNKQKVADSQEELAPSAEQPTVPVEASEEAKTVAKNATVKEETSVVIVSMPGLERETLLALRSFIAFLRGCFKFIMVGVDLPDMDDHLRDSTANIPFDFSSNYYGDMIELMKLLTACDEVSDSFVFVPPRCWLVDRIGLEHLLIPKHAGLFIGAISRNSNAEALVNTRDIFAAENYPVVLRDYNTGYPMCFQKAFLVDVFEFIDKHGEDVDIFSCYGNMLFGMNHPIECRLEDEWGLCIKSENISVEAFAHFITYKCFLRSEVALPTLAEEYICGLLDVNNVV